MKRGFWDKRIPTLLGLIIIILGTVLTTFLVNKKQFTQVSALNSDQPQNVRVTNISDTSFTVTYTTQNQISGSINYGEDKTLGQNALDDRDQLKNSVSDYIVHTITAENLKPSTKYYFTITSGQQAYTTDGNDFEITTGPSLEGNANQTATLEGKIININGSIPSEAIIYLTAENSQVISFLIDKDGNYNYTLSKVRTIDLSSFYNFVDNQTVKMLVVGKEGNSNIILSVPTDKIPTITLSKDYDFTQDANTEASQSANLNDSLPTTDTSTESASSPQIITPENNQGFEDSQPLFSGTAVPDQDVQIVIHSSQQIQAVVTADSLGNWNYQPSEPLSPGDHTITITTKNSLGILETLTQSFIVYASTDSPTPTPEIIVDTITPAPQDLLTEPSTISATPTGQLPPSGNPAIIGVGIIGLIVSLMGGLLFLLTRGGI